MNVRWQFGVLLLLTASAAGCGADTSSHSPFLAASQRVHRGNLHRVATTPIQHVIFIIQENRSFNNLFMGYPGAKTQSYGYDTTGAKIALHAQGLATTWDIGPFSPSFFAACDGQGKLPGTHCKMDGWNNEHTTLGAPANFAFAYVPETEVDPYWKMAQQYVLADNLFSSNFDGSFVAHQFSVAAYASRAADEPDGPWGCEGGRPDTVPTITAKRTPGKRIIACFDNPTIGTEADAAGIGWRFYTGSVTGNGGLWSSYQAIKSVYKGPDWAADVINPQSQFLTDIAAGRLANITWITPTYQNSDHPGVNSSNGPNWVTSLVNAVGTSQYWNSSVIFIMWDDWGGWFDPVQPLYKDYTGLGFRVPLIVISPYAKSGYVTHVQYETASVLKFIEDNFGLPPLAAADARAKDPAGDAFDFAQQPRKFKIFGGGKSSAYWILQDRFPRWHARPASFFGDD
jgi:phospholipase C